MLVILIAMIIAYTALLFRTYLPLYLSNQLIFIKITMQSDKMIILAELIEVFYNIYSYINSTNYSLNVSYIFIIYFVIKSIITYSVTKNNFHTLSDVKDKYDKIARTIPEMVVIELNTFTQIIPLKNLMANDLILTAGDQLYSLSYCLLCNTVHAYYLPEIDGEAIEISSHGGGVINGNKVLYDQSGNYVWQQFNGKGISDQAKPYQLKEIIVNRILWQFVEEMYPKAMYFRYTPNKVRFVYYRMLGKLSSKLSFFKFTRFKYDPILPAKMPVAGVSFLMKGSKAYPMNLFKYGEIIIIEDKIKEENYTLVFNGIAVNGFKETGLKIKNNHLTKNNLRWTLTGKSLDEQKDLDQINITSSAYWYMWNQMNPETELIDNIDDLKIEKL